MPALEALELRPGRVYAIWLKGEQILNDGQQAGVMKQIATWCRERKIEVVFVGPGAKVVEQMPDRRSWLERSMDWLLPAPSQSVYRPDLPAHPSNIPAPQPPRGPSGVPR